MRWCRVILGTLSACVVVVVVFASTREIKFLIFLR
jgi:hypothetical protein